MKRNAFQQQRKAGIALPMVLWAVFVMSTICIVVVGLVSFDLDLETLAEKRFRARQAALTGMAYASHPELKRGSVLFAQKLPNGDNYEVFVTGEDARLNINKLMAKSGDTAPLIKLFRYWGVTERDAQNAADSLKDWVDANTLRSLNGAEAADLQGQSVYSIPENRPFLAIKEMARVRGMDVVARVKPDWADYFSIHSSNRFDLQDVSPDFLEVFASMTSEQAKAIVKYRNGPDGKPNTADDKEITSAEALEGLVSLNEIQSQALSTQFTVGSGLRRITSLGYCAGIKYEISALKQQGQNESIVEWAEQ